MIDWDALQRTARVYAKRYARTNDEAEDFAQDAIVKALETSARIPEGVKDKTAYLITVISNRMIDISKYESRRRNVRESFNKTNREGADSDLLDWLESSSGTSPNSVYDDVDFVIDFERALSRLGDIYREALLVRIKSESVHDAASRMGVPVGTVKSRTHRAVIDIRHFMGLPPLPSMRGGRKRKDSVEVAA